MSVTNVYKINCDPCGICCLIVLYSLLVYSDLTFVIFFVFSSQVSVLKLLNCVLYQFVVVMIMWSHSKASFSDPGVVLQPKHNLDFSNNQIDTNAAMLENGVRNREWSICSKCETYRPPKAHHCRICRKCIRKMDHHCPWINNCVGEFNQKYFLQFLFYVGILCFQTLITILMEFLRKEKHPQIKIIHTVALLVEALLFGIFVTAVMTDQLQAIFNSETRLEKGRAIKKLPNKSKKSLLSEVFGPGPTYFWLFPCKTISEKRSLNFVV